MKYQDRIVGLDTIRTVAIIAVVLCHVIEGNIYTFNTAYMNALNNGSRAFALFAFTFGRLGVPFFLLLSGYLLLDKEYDANACIIFWKTKWFKLLLVTEFWIIIYNIFYYVYDKREIRTISLFKEILFLKSPQMNHMWYMFIILGLYLTLPIISNALVKMDTKTLLIPLGILCLLFFFIPTANDFLQLVGISIGNTILSHGYSGGIYGIYLIIGCLLKRGCLKNIKMHILYITFFSSFLFAFFFQVFSYSKNVAYNIWYDNILLLICAITLFEIISRHNNTSQKRIVYTLSYFSFAIYLIHNPIVIILKNYTVHMDNRIIRVFFIWILSIIISYLLARIIYSIPKIGKKLLYMK